MQPIPYPDRYVPLDILRGIALFGVLLVNLLTLFRVSLFAHMTGADASSDTAGSIIAALVSVLLEFKAFTVFSLVFGIGVAVQAERAATRRRAALFLIRRFLTLLAIGLLHILFIWNGDILTLYAVCGILLLPFLQLPTAVVALAGATLIVVPNFLSLPVAFPGPISLPAHAAEATRIYGQGTFGEIFAFRLQETRTLILPLLLLTLPKTLGVMLVGVAAWRSRLLTSGRQFRPWILGLSGITGIAGIVYHNDLAANVPVAFAYTAAILMWIRDAPLLAAGGRMALTNYLMQSIVFSLVFYGFGMGFFGRLDVVLTAGAGIAFYLAQLAFSSWWLDRFHFGPVEWLWRSITYGQRQAVRLSKRVQTVFGKQKSGRLSPEWKQSARSFRAKPEARS